MEPLTDVDWDVLISGTGLPQSILALALSRSGKKVLHVDKHGYYGGSDAALSLHEAEDWVTRINEAPGSTPFESASIFTSPASSEDGGSGKLSPSRAYTLSLSPQLIYSRSGLIPTLVSSRIFRQLEFQAVGSWWVMEHGSAASLNRVPGSREDVFANDSMSNKSKRALIKLLRHLAQQSLDDGDADGGEDSDLDVVPFTQYLESKFHIPSDLHGPFTSLSLSPRSWDETSARYAVERIKRHLGSIGVFGVGFGALLAKWGGGAEISQVGCRACAVGGGVYVLNRGVSHIEAPAAGSQNDDARRLRVQLSDGGTVRSKFVVGSPWDLPAEIQSPTSPKYTKVARSIMIVSSPLESLFPLTSEGGVIPAGAVVFVPGSPGTTRAPVYLIVHSSDTGECPTGQCIIYGSTLADDDSRQSESQSLIRSAATNLLRAADADAKILWSAQYTQQGLLSRAPSPSASPPASSHVKAPAVSSSSLSGRVFSFAPLNLDLAFDEGMLAQVRAVWEAVTGGDAAEERGQFCQFEDRESMDEGEGDEAGLN
ncbi:rab proteins geranylgeranyltransferase component A [Histoplasma capsulatum G186AR]|uniref:Rab proteins geranylgeranyltransferase n=2 Tax=Ajellomyces capsulatus TaxID=5037 RepID=C0NRK9_AJECG|nr:rab proteins geranylgeranyltransferase component A [Histoplasma capsulatum G186AR]EEH06323.1 rab proteins geranylgeranyltransferase component A [Histoplasma capsulatum G186AR]